MANEVSTSVKFHQINDAAKDRLKEIYSRIREQDRKWFGDIWVDGTDGSPSYSETEQYTWTTMNMGPKWCYFEDYDDTGFYTSSAWSYPAEGIQWLLSQLAEVDPNIITSVSYQDESPNFAGVWVYEGAEEYDGYEESWDEIRDRIMKQNPELYEGWDEDDEDWKDEHYQDLFNDNLWSSIDDAQWEFAAEMSQIIKSEQNSK